MNSYIGQCCRKASIMYKQQIEYHYDTISVPGGMPQLVSQELFDKVQKRFEINKHRGKETP